LQGGRKDSAATKATIVTKAQFFFVIGPFAVHDGVIFSRWSPSREHARKGGISE
jgi:hypothetical protein